MSAVPHSESAAALRERYGLFIAGSWVAGSGTFATLNPATGDPLTEVAAADQGDLERAVRGARRGFEKYWRKLRPSERAKHLFRFARALDERSRELAVVESLDAGTPIRYARETAVPQAVATLYHYAGWADKLQWAVRSGERSRPLGVVAALAGAPSPALAVAVAVAPALACGNTVILAPSDLTPLAALLLAQAALDSDLPPGTLSVVTGDAEMRLALTDHAGIDAVDLAGPRSTGGALARSLAGTQKRTMLRIDSPGIALVYDDARLIEAVAGVVRAATGQRGPFAPSAMRLFVQEGILESFLGELEGRLAELRQGDPLDETTEIGPLLSAGERETAEAWVRGAREGGARVLQAAGTPPNGGYWHAPAFVAQIPAASPPPPGPLPAGVVPVHAFSTVAGSIELARSFGAARAAAVWTPNLQVAARAARGLRAANIWCDASDRYDPAASLGATALGRGGAGSELREYLET